MCAASAFGCGGKAAKKPSAHIAAVPASEPVKATPAAVDKPVTASPNVAVSDDLAHRCKLELSNPDQAPKFSYDDSELLPADREVLQKVAECLIRGPLQGHSVQLVGRADPRGTDEYNLGLGTRRAQTVQSYLERLGVPSTRLSPTTKGEIDASGSDEAGWQRDRRVDLELAN
ncbi:MAG TPA: OmpA family protein [Kofleriaceae bacterium]|nr:OmpA family protein [Kofleriaceae bacterium]